MENEKDLSNGLKILSHCVEQTLCVREKGETDYEEDGIKSFQTDRFVDRDMENKEGLSKPVTNSVTLHRTNALDERKERKDDEEGGKT